MKFFHTCLSSLLLITQAPTAALASDRLTLSGFGTFGYEIDDNKEVATNRDIGQRSHNGYARGPGWRMDSRLGVQIESQPSPVVDLVAQAIAYSHYKPTLGNSVQLAYLGLHPNTDWTIRLGRVGYDAFLMADYRNVGYAYTYVRPPIEFYGWIPIFFVDGMDATYKFPIGDDGVLSIKGQAGKKESWIPVDGGRYGGYQLKTDDLKTFSVLWQSPHWRFKAAYSSFTVDTEISLHPQLNALRWGLDQITQANLPVVSREAADLLQQVSFKGVQIHYAVLGGTYDDNTWRIQAEVGHSSATANAVPHGNMAYASVGHRFGNWMPFFMFSTYRAGQKMRGENYNLGDFDALRSGALSFGNATRTDQNTTSLGVRWDFCPRTAFKLQLDSTRNHPPGSGIWNMSKAQSIRSIRLNQITATVDFVF